MTKQIVTIPAGTLEALSRYSWPGNIRELENVVERSVILTRGTELQVPLTELEPEPAAAGPKSMTLEETERAEILRILRETHWVIGGPEGAAARLGLKRTTLAPRMEKLGIVRPRLS